MPDDLPGLTDRVIVGAIVVLALYNVAVGLLSGGDATISARLQHHATRYPIIPFVVGGICMHWFWPIRGIRP